MHRRFWFGVKDGQKSTGKKRSDINIVMQPLSTKQKSSLTAQQDHAWIESTAIIKSDP